MCVHACVWYMGHWLVERDDDTKTYPMVHESPQASDAHALASTMALVVAMVHLSFLHRSLRHPLSLLAVRKYERSRMLFPDNRNKHLRCAPTANLTQMNTKT